MIALIFALTATNAAGLRTNTFKPAALTEQFTAKDNFVSASQEAKDTFINKTVDIYGTKKTELELIAAELKNSKDAAKAALLAAKAVEKRSMEIKKEAAREEKQAKDTLIQAKKAAIKTKFADEKAIKERIAAELKAQKQTEKDFKMGVATQKMDIVDAYKMAVAEIKAEERVAMRDIQRAMVMNKAETEKFDEELKEELMRINKSMAFESASIAQGTQAAILELKQEETAAKLALKLSFEEKYAVLENDKLAQIQLMEGTKAQSKDLMRQQYAGFKAAVIAEKQNLMRSMTEMKMVFQEKMARLSAAKMDKDAALAALAMGPVPEESN